MASIELNILQERELGRLLDYERATCTVDGELVYRCAFPLRPDDDLQRELIERGALAKRPDDRRGTVVAITTDGYSYFPAKRKEQEERNRDKHRCCMRDHRLFVGQVCGIARNPLFRKRFKGAEAPFFVATAYTPTKYNRASMAAPH